MEVTQHGKYTCSFCGKVWFVLFVNRSGLAINPRNFCVAAPLHETAFASVSDCGPVCMVRIHV